MNCITLHIQYLLRRHSCVIMPRLGALIATEQPAMVNEEWGVVRPPMREISFNAAIVNNDGLLATSIARRESISYEAACSRMEQGIDELRRRLDAGQEVTLGRIGTLVRTADGRLMFEPATKAPQRAALLGYSVVKLPSEKKEQPAAAPASDPRYYHLRISRKIVRVAASVAVPLMAALSILFWTISVTDNVAPQADRIDYASVLPVPQPKQTEVKETPQVTADPNLPQGTVVVAVFDTQDKAQLFMNQHAASPYSLTTEQYGKSWRVTACGDADRESLVKLIHNTDFIVEFPGAWIWMRD